MNNVIILGSGRSGTSMVAGTLAKSGYFMGQDLYPPRITNPKGFFEDPEINDINECIIMNTNYGITKKIINIFSKYKPKIGQLWLSIVPLSADMTSSNSINSRIHAIVNKKPFCLKDPRFSYTLPVWMPYLENTVFVCVFRSPYATIESILNYKKVEEMDIYLNRQIAESIWINMYEHILQKHSNFGKWLFIHYNQVLTSRGLNKIRDISGAIVDKSFPESSISQTVSRYKVSDRAMSLYADLCDKAEYSDDIHR